MEAEGRQLLPEEALHFILAGNAKFSIKHKTTGNHLTYRVRKADQEKPDSPWFVSVLTGNAESNFTYIGCLWNSRQGPTYRHGTKSGIGSDATSVKVLEHIIKQLVGECLHANFEIWHEGCCGRCGRTLTVPESINSGFGPECVKLILKKGGLYVPHAKVG
jgi:Family of unknown function (DUF6011)